MAKFDCFDERGVFLKGKFDYESAKILAKECDKFLLDSDEDEIVCDTSKPSCYNCLFRRWNKDSFECLKLR
ncbi:molybdopterin biosynthesis protein MoeB [Campylobacter sp. RM16188]|uniref:molybdopterin biosynthesis protein MoeB n=1 Tax=Campylobacter sp. RM16188 TaxID=1705725 RepID=UPI0015524A31